MAEMNAIDPSLLGQVEDPVGASVGEHGDEGFSEAGGVDGGDCDFVVGG